MSNPDELLTRAANRSFEKPQPTAMFCKRSVKRFKWSILVLILIVLFIIASCFWIIPLIIRSTINQVDINTVELQYLDLYNVTNEGVRVSLRAIVPRFAPIPITAYVDEFPLHVKDKHDHILATIQVPAFPLSLNKPVVFDFDTSITFHQENKKQTKALIDQFSSKEGLVPQTMVADGYVAFKVWGVYIYRHLYIQKGIKIVHSIQSNVLNLMSVIPNMIFAKDAANLSEKYSSEELIQVNKDLAIKFHELDLNMKEDALSVHAIAEFSNPTVLGMDIPSFHFGLHVRGSEFVKVYVDALQLKRGIQTLTLSANIVPHSQDPGQLGKSISELLNSLLGSANYSTEVGVCGPFHLEGSEFIRFVTQQLNLYLPVKDLVDSVDSNMTSYVQEHILPNIATKISVHPEGIHIPLSIDLPRWMILPNDIAMPFGMGMSLVGPQLKDIVTFKVSRMGVMNHEQALTLQAFLEIRPHQRPEAADELASMVNPLFLSNESANFYFQNIAVFPSNDQQKRQWADLALHIQVPSLFTVDQIVNQLNQIEVNATMAELESLSVQMLDKEPGIAISSLVKLFLPAYFPKISAQMGYLSMDAQVDQASIASIILEKGMTFHREQLSVNAKTLIAKENVSENVQKVIDTLWHHTRPSVLVGISGLELGSSKLNRWTIFSKVQLAIQTSSMETLIKKLDFESLRKKLVHLHGVNAQLKTSKHLEVKASLKIPPGISMKMGPIHLAGHLDGHLITKASVSRLSSGHLLNPVVQLYLNDGKNGLAAKVALVVHEFLKTGKIQSSVALTGLTLGTPKTAGYIDHFSKVKIEVLPLVQVLLSKDSPIDIASILPSMDMLTRLDPEIYGLSLNALPGAELKASPKIHLTNPLPLAGSIGFLSTRISSKSHPILNLKCQHVSVAMNRFEFHPIAHMSFNNDLKAQENVRDLVQSIKTWQWSNQSLELGHIYFGTSENDVNDLLSELNVNLLSFLPPSLNLKVEHLTKMDFRFPQIQSVKLQTLPGKELSVGTSLYLGIPVHINSGHFEGHLGLNSVPIGSILTGHVSTSHSTIHVAPKVKIHDSEQGSIIIGQLVKNIMSQKALQATVRLSGMVFGASPQDAIRTFQLVDISIQPFDWIRFNSINVQSLVNPLVSSFLRTKLDRIKLHVQNNRQLSTSLSGNLQIPNLSMNVGFGSIQQISLNRNSFISGQFSQLSCSENGYFDLNHLLLSLSDSEFLSSSVAGLFYQIMQGYPISGMLSLKGVEFGHGYNERIGLFSKIEVEAPLNALVGPLIPMMKPILLNLYESVNVRQLLRKLKYSKSEIRWNLDEKYGVTLTQSNFGFSSRGLEGNLVLFLNVPFALDINIPYLAFQVAMDSITVFDVSLAAIKLGNQESSLSLVMTPYNQRRFSDSFSKLLNTGLNGVAISVGGIELGYNDHDLIRVASKCFLEIRLLDAVSMMPSLHAETLINRLLDILKPKLLAANGKNQDGLLFASATVTHKLLLPIHLNVPYLSMNLHMDDAVLLKITVQSLSVKGPYGTVSLDITLADDRKSHQLLEFDNNVFSVGRLALGASQDSLFMNLIHIPFQIALQDLPLEHAYGIIEVQYKKLSKNIQNRVKMNHLAVKMPESNQFDLDIEGALLGDFPDLSLDIQSTGLSIWMQEKGILDMNLSMLTVRTSSKGIHLTLNGNAQFKDSESARKSLAYFVQNVLKSPKSVQLSFGNIRNLPLGSKIYVKLPIHRYVPMVESLAKKYLERLDEFTLPGKLDAIRVGIASRNVIKMDTQLSSHYLEKVNMDIPMAAVHLQVDHGLPIVIKIQSIKVKSGKAKVQVFVHLPTDPKTSSLVFKLIGNFAFLRPNTLFPVLTVSHILFGVSEDSLCKIGKSIELDIHTEKALVMAKEEFFASVETSLLGFADIQGSISERGIEAKVVARPLPDWLPVTLDIKSVYGYLLYNMNEPKSDVTTDIVADFNFENLDVRPGRFAVDLLIVPKSDDGFHIPFAHAVKRMLLFEDFAAHAQLGYARLYPKSPADVSSDLVVDYFKEAQIYSAPLYLWRPWIIIPRLRDDPDAGLLSMEVVLQVPNPGPLHIDLGQLNIGILGLANVYTKHPVVILNENEGGRNASINPQNAALRLDVSLCNITHIFDSDKRLVIDLVKPGEGSIHWFNNAINRLPNALQKDLKIILVSLMAESSIKMTFLEKMKELKVKWTDAFRSVWRSL